MTRDQRSGLLILILVASWVIIPILAGVPIKPSVPAGSFVPANSNKGDPILSCLIAIVLLSGIGFIFPNKYDREPRTSLSKKQILGLVMYALGSIFMVVSASLKLFSIECIGSLAIPMAIGAQWFLDE